MREDLGWEAAEEEGLRRMYEELAPHAINEFTAERLKSYYLANRKLAQPAHEALSFARSLATPFPRAAVVFGATTIEVTLKRVLLKPLIYGLVHNDALAEFIASLSIKHNGGLDPFKDLLENILQQFAEIELETFKRDGSGVPIIKEMKDIQESRNKIIHSAATEFDGLAPLAIDVASTFLNIIFPRLLVRLGLRVDGFLTIRAQ
jgi:hypothetical protein